ncbi:hypothetical protein P171DRAFT_88193 [Karstenula rhodostoma CBS 690.94]|uniref:BZIP domain-containing protein n=1 Tax=Karstenula rhodostoma CBS 690.94 TaxID=1392251 RepID=A0A9P4PDA2_9PLEO|nr:hypothetical protein P171DRAFT_88193 [Karstenula rhodostoma CBS 690.94]
MHAIDADAWRDVSDSQDRKKIQNRLAQRRRQGAMEEGTTTQLPSLTMSESSRSPQSPLQAATMDQAGHDQWTMQDGDRFFMSPDLELDALVDPSLFPHNSPESYPFPMADFNAFMASSNPSPASHQQAKSIAEGYITPSSISQGSVQGFPSAEGLRDAQKRISRLRENLAGPPIQATSSQADGVRFNHIFKAMTAAGFMNFDEMATAYYTTDFARSSAAYDMQRQSRLRHLRSFLSSVKANTIQWGARERRGWTEEILLPDLWSLLTQIVATSGLEQPYSSKVVLSAVQVLIGFGPMR